MALVGGVDEAGLTFGDCATQHFAGATCVCGFVGCDQVGQDFLLLIFVDDSTNLVALDLASKNPCVGLFRGDGCGCQGIGDLVHLLAVLGGTIDRAAIIHVEPHVGERRTPLEVGIARQLSCRTDGNAGQKLADLIVGPAVNHLRWSWARPLQKLFGDLDLNRSQSLHFVVNLVKHRHPRGVLILVAAADLFFGNLLELSDDVGLKGTKLHPLRYFKLNGSTESLHLSV